jgi:hypothetical protein
MNINMNGMMEEGTVLFGVQWDRLSEEILLQIFSFLHPSELLWVVPHIRYIPLITTEK